jgi:hypothetical protein
MIRFQYVHLKRRRHPISIAYVMQPDSSLPSGMAIRFAAAFCNDRDRFHRKNGRELATDRLNGMDGIVLPIEIMTAGMIETFPEQPILESLNQAIVREIRNYVKHNVFHIMDVFCADNDVVVAPADGLDSANL